LSVHLLRKHVKQEVLEYKRGDYFGELALLKNEPRAASVEAKTEAKICKIDRKSFKTLGCNCTDDLAVMVKRQ